MDEVAQITAGHVPFDAIDFFIEAIEGERVRVRAEVRQDSVVIARLLSCVIEEGESYSVALGGLVAVSIS